MQLQERPTVPLDLPAPQLAPARPPAPRVRPLLIALAIFAGSFLLSSYRLDQTIDMNSDEATYAIESVSLYQTGMTRWNGSPFFVHPPLFYLFEGVYFDVRGIGRSPLFQRLVAAPYHSGQALLPPDAPLTDDNVLNAILAGRYLSVLYGALSAVALFVLGTALCDRRIGVLAAVLFMLDPYVVRRNHFNMLEPLATLVGLLLALQFYRASRMAPGAGRWRHMLAAGALFGVALLAKELAVLYLPALILYSLLFRRVRPAELGAVLATGLGLYALFPLWAALSGNFSIWWSTKTWLLQRLSGVLRDTGITRPGGASLGQTLQFSLLDYWPSFVLLGVAGLLAAAFLALYLRRGVREPAAEWLTALVIGGYGFFVVVAAVGGVINEQFFYLLMPFPVLVVAYAILASARRPAPWAGAPDAIERPPTRPEGGRAGLGRRGLATLLVTGVLLAYNLAAWVARYGLSQDASYAAVDTYLARTLPPGMAVAGRDALDLYLLPKNPVLTPGFLETASREISSNELIQARIPVAILNDLALFQRYGGANLAYYDWVRQNGTLLDQYQGRLWNTYVYSIDYNRPGVTALGADSLAVGKPAVASSSESADLGPERAVDGRAATRWASAETDAEWIAVDLGQRTHISRVVLYWQAAFAEHYALQVSDDDQTWTTFYETDQGDGGTETIRAAADGRYVRLLLSRRGTPYGYSLWEFSIYP